MNNEFITEKAKVIKSGNGTALVEITSSSECEHCSAKFLCRSEKPDLRSVEVVDAFNSKPGEVVTIAVRGKSLVQFSFYLYGIPVILIFLSVLAGLEIFNNSSNSELFAFFLGLGILAVYYSGFYLVNKFIGKSERPLVLFRG